MKLKKLIEIKTSLAVLLHLAPLSGGKAIDYALALKKVEPDIDAWDVARKKLIEQHGGVWNEAANKYDFGDQQNAFDKAVEETLDREISGEFAFPNVTLEEVKKIPAIESVHVFHLLGLVIDQKKEEAKPADEQKAPEAAAA